MNIPTYISFSITYAIVKECLVVLIIRTFKYILYILFWPNLHVHSKASTILHSVYIIFFKSHTRGFPDGDPHTYQRTPSGRSTHIQGDSQWEIQPHTRGFPVGDPHIQVDSQLEIHRQTREFPGGDPQTDQGIPRGRSTHTGFVGKDNNWLFVAKRCECSLGSLDICTIIMLAIQLA